MDPVTIANAVAVATSIVEAIVKLAPAIEQGIASSTPFVQAISGLITGTNATQAQIDALLAAANAASAQFESPLPPDVDGSTDT
jgi:hypothetical protein